MGYVSNKLNQHEGEQIEWAYTAPDYVPEQSYDDTTAGEPGLLSSAWNNLVGGIEGYAGGKLNYFGELLKKMDEEGRKSSLNESIRDSNPGRLYWWGNSLTDKGESLLDDAGKISQHYGTLNNYQKETLFQRLTDPDYLTDSRGLIADVTQGVGSSAIPMAEMFLITKGGGLLGRLASGGAKAAVEDAAANGAADLAAEYTGKSPLGNAAKDLGKWAAFEGPNEAITNAGSSYRAFKEQGLSDSEIFDRMNEMAAEELPVDMLTNGIYGAVLGGKTFSRLGRGGVKRALGANALNVPLDMASEYAQEAGQTRVQNKYEGKEYGTFWNPTEEEMEAGRAAAIGAAPAALVGLRGGYRTSRNLARIQENSVGANPLSTPDSPASGPMALIAEANASTNAKLAAENAAAQKAAEPAAQPAFAVAEPEEAQAQDSASADFGAGTYDMPTQGDAITEQVQNLKAGWADVLPQIGGVLHNQFGLDGVISSAARTPEHNAEVGGAPHSHHIDNGDGGDAVDIVLPDGTTAEQAEQVKQYFENSGAFQEVLFHDAGSGYHLHLGGLKGSLGDAGTSAGGSVDVSNLPYGNIAMAISQRTGIPAQFVWAQMAWETGDFSSGLSVDDHNYGGIKQSDGSYRHFDSDEDYIDYASKNLNAYKENGIGNARTIDEFAAALKDGGYFKDDLGHYTEGLKSKLAANGLPESGFGGSGRSSSSTNFLNEKSSFDINSDDAEGRKMIADFIDYWGNRANVDDADTIQGMLDANGKFRNTQENRDTVREKWGDELQQYADEHIPEEEQRAWQAQRDAQQQAETARKAAQGGKKAASADNTKAAIDTSTPSLDAAKQQQVSTTPQATSIDTAGESEQTQAEPAQSLPNTAHLQPNTEHPASETAHPAAAAQANAPAQAKAQQAQPTTQASQPTAQAAPIEQAKAPNVPKNEPQNAQQNSQAPAQPQTPTMDAQQATKQQNALSQPAQTPQQATAQMSPAQQRARAAKEQRLQKELETNATLDQIERGQQLEAAAKQASVALPQGMAGALHRGQAPAIAQATSLLKEKGVALPTVEASGNTVYGAENGGRGNSAQAQAASPLVETGTHVHTKTGKQMPVARLTRQISKEEYKDVAAKAKKHGGRYDGRYAKGFLFKDEAGRDAFAEEVNHETKKSAPLANDSKAQEQPKKAAEKDQTSEPRADFFHVKLGGVDVHVDTAALDAITKKYPRIKDVIAQKLKSAETNKNDAKWLAKLVQMNDDERAEAALGYVYNQARVNYEAEKARGNKNADMEVKLMTARSVMNDFKKGDITPQEAYRELDQLLPETKPADLTGLDVDEHAKVKTKAETQESKDAEAFQHATDAMDKAEAFFDGTKKSLESVQRAIDNAIQGYTDGSMVSDARRISQLENYGNGIVRDLRKKVKEKESPAPQAKAADTSIFGSVEDADKELFEEFGIQPDEEETFTAPDGIENTAEVRAQLEKELTAELNKLGANPVFNPKIYELGVRIAFTYVKDGINTAKKLVATLEAKFGDKIGPWAPAIVETVRTWPKGVAFDAGKVRALSKAVGARYEKGIQTREGMHADMKKTLGGHYDSFAPMIDAAYNGIEKFFHPEKEADGNGHGTRPGESAHRGSEVQQSREVRGAEEEGQSRGHRGGIPLEGEKEGGRVLQDHDGTAAEKSESVRGHAEVERDHNDRAGNGERGNHELASLRDDQKQPSAKKTAGHNYEIKGDGAAPKTAAQRVQANLKAIQLLKQLESEGRMPTPQEQDVLAAYSSWGGLTNAFKDGTKENTELRKLLAKDEYDAAKRSILDAYFTPPAIVRAIWKGVSSLGFHGGRVLDPSMGVGNFFGCMPRSMMKASSLHGAEIDSLSSRFAKMLYPKADIENTGFQNAHVGDGAFDLVISNVPFSQAKVGKYALHNFFFAQGIDKVRPGGLMVFITSQSSLTSSGDAHTMRQYLASKADLIGAFKLPSGVFKGTGTDVATDVLVFQKRGKDNVVSKHGNGFQNVMEYTFQKEDGTSARVPSNKYFYDHPENVLGKKELGRDRFGKDALNIVPKKGQDTAAELERAMSKLPEVYKPVNRTQEKPYRQKEADVKARSDEKKFRDREYYEHGGKLYQNEDGTPALVPPRKAKVVKAYLGVRDAMRTLFIAENDPKAKESTIDVLRKKLGKVYDDFTAKHGYLNDPKNIRLFGDDPSAGSVLALERDVTFDGRGAKRRVVSAEKTDIFYQRTVQAAKPVTHAKNANDALLASLNQKGSVDVDYMAKLTGKSKEAVIAELGDAIYHDPETGDYQTKDEYLSGNVREKLAQAQDAAKKDPAFQRNVDALKNVIPADLVSSEILVNINSPWIPVEDLNAFLEHLTGASANGWQGMKVTRASNGRYVVDGSGWGASRKWGSNGIDFNKLIDAILNNKPIEVAEKDDHGKRIGTDQKATDAANAAADRIRDEFQSWIWSDKAREQRLVSYYNENYNGEVLRKYNGAHLTFPGMNSTIKLRAHQKNVVWRILQKANTLIAHCVGAGKTFEMQAAGMEMRRLGIANKPLYCVPNNIVEQFAREFQTLYPNAKLLVLKTGDDLPEVFHAKVTKTEDGRKVVRELKPSEMSPADRAKYEEKCRLRLRALTRIKTEDWDGIIMSHQMFERLPASGDTVAAYIQEQIDVLEATLQEAQARKNAGKNANGLRVRDLEQRKQTLQDRLNEALNQDTKAVGIPFEELGIDQIFVDEADMFKNLNYTTTIGGVSGLTNSNANRSVDMFIKTQWLTQNNGGRGVVFATGTPISNTMAEMYTMMRYLDLAGLKEKGLHLFDNWIRQYADIGTGIERKPSGDGFRKVQKVRRFLNMPELTKKFRKFADVFTRDDLIAEDPDITIPKLKGDKRTVIALAPDPVVVDYIKHEVPKRIAAMKSRRKMKKGDDNMLALTNDLRKLSMTDKKIDACAAEAARVYQETDETHGAQAIFCDMGVPRAEKENAASSTDTDADEAESENRGVYDRLIERLVAHGIPREQIAFVQSAKNKQAQDELFQKVDRGDIRIIIGSTQKMGAGTNFQHHLAAEHHLDAPWRPRDIEQREGRILRQGNGNKQVEVFTYVVKDSFDANMWEKLKNKASIINQAMSDNISARAVEDADLVTLSYADVEGAATGNPLIKKKLDAEVEVAKYTNASVQFQRNQRKAEQDAQDLPQVIENAEETLKRVQDDAAARVDTHGDKFSMTVAGKTYTKRAEADKALAALPLTTKPQTVGSIGGFEIHAWQMMTGETKVQLVRKRAYPATKLNAAGIENALRGGIDKALEARTQELETAKTSLQQAQETLKDENPYAEKLKAARENLRQIVQQIDTAMTKEGKEETDTEAAPTDTAKEKPYNPDNGLHVATKDDRKWFDQHVIVAKVPDKSQNKSEEQKPTRYESADVFSRTALWDPTTGKAEPSARLTIHADDFIMGKLIPFAEKYEGGYYDAKQKRFFFENEKSRDAFVRDATNFINFNSEHVHYSVSEGDQRLAKAQTMDDLNKATQKVFPGSSEAEHTTRKNADGTTQDIFKFRLANGTDIEIHTGENINLPEREKARARREHGIDEGRDITVNGMEQSSETAITVNGRTVTKSSLAKIVLSRVAKFTDTLYHEAFHVAYDLFLTEKEKGVIERAYGKAAAARNKDVVEFAADRYRDWAIGKITGNPIHTYGKLWQKINNGAKMTVEVMDDAEEAAYIFQAIKSGEMWSRPLDRATRERDNEAKRVARQNEREIRRNFMKEVHEKLLTMRNPQDEAIDAIFYDSNAVKRTRAKFFFFEKQKDKEAEAFEASRLYELLGREFEHDEIVKSIRQENRARNEAASSEGFHGGNARGESTDATRGRDSFGEGSRSGGVQDEKSTLSVLTKNRSDRIYDYYVKHKGNHKTTTSQESSRPESKGGFSDAENEQETRSNIHYSAEEAKERKSVKDQLHKVSNDFAKKVHLKGDDIMAEEDQKPRTQEDITSLQATVLSPSRVASKVKTFRVIYSMADRAMNKLVSLRNDFGRKYDKALSLVSSKDDRTALFDMLLRGDAEGKEWTRQELLDEGVKENVADAYMQIRHQLNKAYHLVNNARRAPVGKSETVDGARMEALQHSNFVTDLSVTDKGNGKYLVSYKEYRNYPTEHKGVDAEAVEAFRKNPGMDVVDVVEAGEDGEGRKLYDVKTLEGPADLHKLTGYIPHFFHEYLILAPDGDGMKVVGSGRTQREAIQKAEAYKKEHPLGEGEVIRIRPKTFNINEALGISEDEYLPIVGDKDFRQVQENLAKQNDMTLDEAKDMLDGTMRRKGRHRFFGNALHRKGAEGFETDLNWALRHYFNSASRYVAMETEFKPKAISFFERVFGAFDKDYKDNALARYCKDYINDINGNPSALEQRITKLLTKEIPGVRWMFKNVITPTFGDRAALTLGNSIANKVSYLTLGLNMSSALLNFTQLMNSAAYLGDARTLITMVAKGLPHRKHGKEPRYSMHELRVLHEAGVFNDIGLDSGSGYDKMRGGGETLGAGRTGRTLARLNSTMDYFGSKSMRFFQEADAICRRGTVLAAYEKARKEGKSHAEAIAYARDINYKANFQYGVQDAANIFRRGSILSQMLLQFKKYGMKELEVMHDFTFSNKTSRKQKLLFWGMYAMLCGAMGIPALDWLDDILGEKLGWAYPKDAIQKFFINNFPKPVAKMLMYGGAAVLNANLSNRAGLSDVIPTSLGDFAGPTLSKSARFISDLHDGAWANALRDVSPGLYNMYAAGTGESRGKRDRLNDRYVTAWDRILRAVGFRSVDETIPTDMQRIISREKSAATKERQEAQDAYIQNPTSENKQRLKDLGIKEKDVQKEATKKNQTREERTQGTVPKKDKDKYKPLTDFMKE